MKKLFAVVLILCLALSVCAAAEEGGYTFPYTGDPITIDFYWIDWSFVGFDQRDSIIAQKFKEMLGNVVWNDISLGFPDYDTKYALILSSGDLPDIFFGGAGTAAQYAGSGILLNFHEYEDVMPRYKALYEKYPTVYNWVNVDGVDGVYSLHQPRTVDQTNHVTCINYQMVEEKGYKIPTTYDELLEVLRQVKADYPDCVPFLGYWQGQKGDMWMQYNTWNGMFYNFDTQAWEYGPLNEGYKAYVEFMHTLYEEGLVHEHFYNMENEEFQSYYLSGNWFMYMGYNQIGAAQEAAIQAENPGWHFDGILPLTPDGGLPRMYMEYFRGAPSDGVMVAADTENPEFVCALLDYLISDEIGALVSWGIEGETYAIDDNGEKYLLIDTVSDGGAAAAADYGLTAHCSIKVGGPATLDDYNSMTYIFGIDQNSTAFKLEQRQLAYLQEHPEKGFYLPTTPPLTAEEGDEAAIILTDLSTYCDEQTQLFITGKRDLSEWDKFVGELASMGDIDWLCETYNSYEMPVYVNE